MGTSFKTSRAYTGALSVPDPAAGHRQPTPLLETPGPSQASLGQSLLGSLLLSPGSWCTQGFVCALQESIFQSCVSSVINHITKDLCNIPYQEINNTCPKIICM